MRYPFINGHRMPGSCAFCGDPFPIEGNRLRAWKGSDGQFYCSKDCEEAEAYSRVNS